MLNKMLNDMIRELLKAIIDTLKSRHKLLYSAPLQYEVILEEEEEIIKFFPKWEIGREYVYIFGIYKYKDNKFEPLLSVNAETYDIVIYSKQDLISYLYLFEQYVLRDKLLKG